MNIYVFVCVCFCMYMHVCVYICVCVETHFIVNKMQVFVLGILIKDRGNFFFLFSVNSSTNYLKFMGQDGILFSQIDFQNIIWRFFFLDVLKNVTTINASSRNTSTLLANIRNLSSQLSAININNTEREIDDINTKMTETDMNITNVIDSMDRQFNLDTLQNNITLILETVSLCNHTSYKYDLLLHTLREKGKLLNWQKTLSLFRLTLLYCLNDIT